MFKNFKKGSYILLPAQLMYKHFKMHTVLGYLHYKALDTMDLKNSAPIMLWIILLELTLLFFSRTDQEDKKVYSSMRFLNQSLSWGII